MAIITLFSAAYCESENVADLLVKNLGYERLDEELLEKTSQRFNIAKKKLMQAMEGPPFVFNKFTHRRQQYLAKLRLVLAEMLSDKQILHGFAAHLIPREMSHVLRVCLVSDPEYRVQQLKNEKGCSLKDAQRMVHDEDQKRAQWSQFLFRTTPWDKTLYDLKIPVNAIGVNKTLELITENTNKNILDFTNGSERELTDFVIATQSESALIEAGYYHSVTCAKGIITVIVDEYVMRLERLEAELKSILSKIDEAKEVRVKTGPNYRPTSVFANVEFDFPEKVLLVDDEKDFVLTLSERLEMRDLESTIANSGEEALSMLKEEEPDVMVLDLKMPGIDGIEVLRRVKKDHSEVEVVVLTGHGSEKDKQLCLDLGAFAYLEKPVDIEVLSETMQQAKEAIKKKQMKE